jgi:hypothetical protein
LKCSCCTQKRVTRREDVGNKQERDFRYRSHQERTKAICTKEAMMPGMSASKHQEA